jgi:allophanate hydrolase
MSELEVTACGDDLLMIRTGSTAESARIATALRTGDDWLEIVPGIADVVVRFDAASVDSGSARERLAAALRRKMSAVDAKAACVEIPVVYGGEGGPDLESICRQAGLSRNGVIELHTGREYTVDLLGFTPGFAYIGGLDPRLDVPRLEEPRTRVMAGSIGIAGGRTGIYALAGPGGWPLIGRTTKSLFDPRSEEPFLLQAGMRVRFADASA